MPIKLLKLEALGRVFEVPFDDVVKIEMFEIDPRNAMGARWANFVITYADGIVAKMVAGDYYYIELPPNHKGGV